MQVTVLVYVVMVRLRSTPSLISGRGRGRRFSNNWCGVSVQSEIGEAVEPAHTKSQFRAMARCQPSYISQALMVLVNLVALCTWKLNLVSCGSVDAALLLVSWIATDPGLW